MISFKGDDMRSPAIEISSRSELISPPKKVELKKNK